MQALGARTGAALTHGGGAGRPIAPRRHLAGAAWCLRWGCCRWRRCTGRQGTCAEWAGARGPPGAPPGYSRPPAWLRGGLELAGGLPGPTAVARAGRVEGRETQVQAGFGQQVERAVQISASGIPPVQFRRSHAWLPSVLGHSISGSEPPAGLQADHLRACSTLRSSLRSSRPPPAVTRSQQQVGPRPAPPRSALAYPAAHCRLGSSAPHRRAAAVLLIPASPLALPPLRPAATAQQNAVPASPLTWSL